MLTILLYRKPYGALSTILCTNTSHTLRLIKQAMRSTIADCDNTSNFHDNTTMNPQKLTWSFYIHMDFPWDTLIFGENIIIIDIKSGEESHCFLSEGIEMWDGSNRILKSATNMARKCIVGLG